jgi:hypothetical protein
LSPHGTTRNGYSHTGFVPVFTPPVRDTGIQLATAVDRSGNRTLITPEEAAQEQSVNE